MVTTETSATMKILILGASGQIGNSLYNYLKIKTDLVHGTSRTGCRGLIKFNPFTDLWEFPTMYDVVINCIGAIQETNEFSFEKIHLGISELIVKNQFRLGNPKIIQLSVLGADAFSPIDFLRSKAQADEYLLSNPYSTVVRPSIVCTPGTMLAKKLKLAGKISKVFLNRLIVPSEFSSHKIQPVMVDDLVKIIYQLCVKELPQKIVYVTGPEELSYQQLLEKANRNIKLIRIQKSKIKKPMTLLCKAFPKLINKDQYKLLFSDNIADNAEATLLRGKSLESTEAFWKRELN
jgi:dTDP-4-dehydrorhamnose reductase